ncbi:mitochondrial brown fat uncoupling protein 1 isoform X2 [Hemiscyllium ocellatum]|uniref:mitochondrial brown fat uncoupling protein 1 isoform X2 n=1 Tax=Hemiscyllium ocellatum TaxID=170820 RepID=UPI002966C1EC|nr:mitochondrial brown fat uncoupling protein 1 isoform X2 [Hemiscyllium ocellatum]
MVGLQPSSIPVTPGVQILSAGMAACFADLITFPLDTSKVRLQIQGEATRSSEVGVPKSIKYRGVWGTIGTIVRTEGPRSLYNGLIAGLQRQMIFASIRIGLYDSVKQLYTGQDGNTGMVVRLLAGCTTGALAVLVAQPTDVVKVRFQAQVNLRGVTKRYHGTLQAYKSIAREEGIRGLWKGTLPNIARNAIVNCSELVTYDIIKEAILRENLLTGFFPLICALAAGM